jgi:hypothetical protein
MPTLQQLEAEFIKYEKGIADEYHGRPQPDGTMQYGGFEINVLKIVENIAEAQGINFLCPLCFVKNNGSAGTHTVSISFSNRGVTDEQGSRNDKGEPSRWDIIAGTGLSDLQLSPSIHLTNPKGCGWHGFVGSSGVPAGHAQ